jgi:hypothetical protein
MAGRILVAVVTAATLLCVCGADVAVVDVPAAGFRRENPAFAKQLAFLRSENARLEAETAALKQELEEKVRGMFA